MSEQLPLWGAPDKPQPVNYRSDYRLEPPPTQNPDQFAMFMTAREIKSKYNALNGDREERYTDDDLSSGSGWGSGGTESNDDVWDRKASESEDSGLMDKIEQSGGVRQPIPLSTIPVHSDSEDDDEQPRPQLLNGHHRLASMGVINPDQFIAVTHHNTEMVQFGNVGGAGRRTGEPLPEMRQRTRGVQYNNAGQRAARRAPKPLQVAPNRPTGPQTNELLGLLGQPGYPKPR